MKEVGNGKGDVADAELKREASETRTKTVNL